MFLVRSIVGHIKLDFCVIHGVANRSHCMVAPPREVRGNCQDLVGFIVLPGGGRTLYGSLEYGTQSFGACIVWISCGV